MYRIPNIIRRIFRFIPVRVKARVHYWLSKTDKRYVQHLQGKKKAIIGLAADYGNLGDVAITVAQARFLSDLLPDYEIVYLPCAATYGPVMKSLTHICTPDDLITIIGGGNMGDLYPSLEDARRFIVEIFPDNRVVSFPQTVDFSDTPQGRRELRRTCKAYGRHRDLHLFAREPISLEKMKEYFPHTPVYLVPDIVLYLDASKPKEHRQGVLLCFRDDLECVSPPHFRNHLINYLTSRGFQVNSIDTFIKGDNRLPIDIRERELQELLNAFRKAEFVLTDRLHGMILSAITGTPCIAFRSRNYKIKMTYDMWLSAHNHIRFQEVFDLDYTLQLIEHLRKLNSADIQPPKFGEHYEPLRKVVLRQK